MATTTAEMNFSFYLLLINFDLHSHMCRAGYYIGQYSTEGLTGCRPDGEKQAKVKQTQEAMSIRVADGPTWE